ncbi:nucleophosmin-like isoform X2 [Echinops telfairi]|uniref:Nucleophosmin-like isoform X2 n=1 Tax=Echinops telfairi TaxID=9371 RepID=A0ABM1VK97_ECHTE|nr:nucleophosmin-like isoform X2 [Echinops telfairi]
MEDSMDTDMSPLKPPKYLFAVEEDAELDDEEEEDVKLLSVSGKRSAPISGNKVPQKKVKLAAAEEDDDDDFDDEEDDDDFDDDETVEKAPVQNKIETSKILQKTPQTRKGPSSVVKAKMQASIEKGGCLPKVEAKSSMT